ncbi:MAG TPA: alpha/beta fold hydrolase [Solirubrobacterales bacterium]|nr:alpha/beta fold hydrolase [Solirubrobacterales bacterium]
MAAHIVSLRVRRPVLIAAVAVAALLLLATGSQRADAKAKPKHAKVTKGPKGLKFYKPPKKLPKQHGTLIWARKAGGLVPLENARYTKLVLYASLTPQNRLVAVSGSVAVPKGKPPKGGWPVISWAHGTTGVADVCAPSRDFAGTPNPTGEAYINPELNAWLAAGYAVLRTDYQGLGTPGKHPYLVGKAEGRGVLDIVQAARELDPRIGKRYLISGHSQGGHAALFAAGEAKKYLPKLRLRGTVAFAPASHILEQSKLLSNLTTQSGLTALAAMILDGASTQSSQIDVNRLLSDRALSLYPLLQQQCLARLGASDEYGGMPPSELERSGADLSALDPVLAAMNPLVRSRAPIQIEQGEADTTVFKIYTDQLKNELIAAGNQITYRTYPGVNHVGVVTTGEPDALTFFQQMLPPGR